MANGVDFSSLDDLSRRLNRAIEEVPARKRDVHKSASDIMYQNVISNIESDTEKKTGNLKEGQVKTVGSGGGYAAVRPNYGIAPHTHLLEEGHKIIRGGRVIGFANGKHFYKKALITSQRGIESAVERFADDIARGL